MLTTATLAWTAGFLEGEGSFSFHQIRTRKAGASPRVSAYQVQREPLDRIRLAFGGNIYWRPTRGAQGIHMWELNGPLAIGLMMTLYALMSPRRREQISTTIAAWRSRPGKGIHHRAKTHCPKGHPYDAENTIVRKTKWGAGRGIGRQCRLCVKDWWARNGARMYANQKERRRLDRHRLLGPELPL